jgi:cytochrome c553
MGKLYSLIGALSLFLLVTGFCLPVQAEENVVSEKPEKLYPHPHSLHMNVMGQNVPEFNRADVMDWAKLIHEMRDAASTLSISPEIQMLLDVVTPTEMSDSDQYVVINELNTILMAWAESERSEKKVQNDLDLQWQIRARLIEHFPSLALRQPGAELSTMTCLTCHNNEGMQTGTYLKQHSLSRLNAETVLDCFAEALAEGRKFGECETLAESLNQTDIEPYKASRNYIQRKKKDTDISFFVAFQPEDPYTFKPLLKNLLCVECHGSGRKVDEIRGKDGKMKKIPLLYGLGAGDDDSAQDITHLREN